MMDKEQKRGARKVAFGAVSLLGVKAVAGLFLLMLIVVVLIGQAEAKAEGPMSSAAAGEIPEVALEAYRHGATYCDAIEWPVLAGIGQIESHHGGLYGGVFDEEGTLRPPLYGVQLSGSGVGGNLTPYPIGEWLGRWGLAGPYQQAMGPMQFMPGTWAGYGTDASGDGYADPQNIFDAAASAAEYLCEGFTDLSSAIKKYNNSDAYVADVLQAAALYAEDGDIGSSGGAGGRVSSDAGDLVNNSNMCLADRARRDLEDGIVDPRLVAALSAAATEFTICVGWFRTDHKACVGGTGTYPDCRLSQHWFGRAADITHVDGEIVHPGNESARRLVDWWFEAYDGKPPDSVGSPWPEAFGFTDANHQDHLHVAFFEGTGDAPTERPSPTATPIPAVRTLITDLYDGNGAIGGSSPATTASMSLSESIAAQAAAAGGSASDVSPTPAPSLSEAVAARAVAAEESHTDDSGMGVDLTAGWGSLPGEGPHGAPERGDVSEVELVAVGPGNLQAAVDDRVAGEVIQLTAGEYGPLYVIGPESVTIIGPVRGTARFSNPSGVAISAMGVGSVTLEGLTIADSDKGIAAVDTSLRLTNVEITGIGGDAIRSRGGSVTMTDAVVAVAGNGLIVEDGRAVVTDSLFRDIAGNSIATSGISQLVASDNALLGSGADAVVGSPQGTIELKRNLIGDVRVGSSVKAGGTVAIKGNLIWGNFGNAIVVLGTGEIVDNALIDGSVWTASGVLKEGNLKGADARALFPRGWLEPDGSAATADAEAVLRSLAP